MRLLLLGAVGVFLWGRLLIGGEVLLLRDVIFDSLPWRRFAAEAIGAGHVPLWNPYSRFGQPFVANPQSAVFYPPHLLFNVMPANPALQVTLAFHLLVAAFSTYSLARFWRLGCAPAALAAVAYAFGGYMTANLEFMSVFETLAWCPLTLLLTARLVERPRLTLVPALALVLALQILPGNPQPFGFTLLLCAAYAVSAAVREVGLRRLGLVAAYGAGAFLLAIGLCMVQLAPTFELLPLSVRAGGVDTGMDIGSMHPRHLSTLLFPFAYGEPAHELWRGKPLFEFWLGSIHMGVVPLVLASFAVLLPKGDRLRGLAGFCAGLAVLGVLLAFGDHTVVYPALAKLPGFDRVRWPAKALQLVAMTLPLLAAIGLHALLAWWKTQPEGARLAPKHIAWAWCAVGVASFLLVAPAEASVSAMFLGLTCGVVLVPPARRFAGPALVVLAFVNVCVQSGRIHPTGAPKLYEQAPRDLDGYRQHELSRVFTNYSHAQYSVYGRDDPNVVRNAVHAMAGESSLPFHVHKTYGGDALQVRETRDVTDLLENPELPGPQADRLAGVLGVRFALVGPPFEEFATDAAPDALRWQVLPGALARAYCVDGFIVEADREQAMVTLLAPRVDPRRTAIVDATTPAFATEPIAASPPARAPVPPGDVKSVRYDANHVAIDVDVRRPCMLVLADTWFPGWKAYAGGVELPIHRVNVVFRGVMVPRGAHTVAFRYEPGSFRTGLAVSAVSALLVLVLFALGRVFSGAAGTPDAPPSAS